MQLNSQNVNAEREDRCAGDWPTMIGGAVRPFALARRAKLRGRIRVCRKLKALELGP
jgi:hypothetical protein